jgi:hypothetical protein
MKMILKQPTDQDTAQLPSQAISPKTFDFSGIYPIFAPRIIDRGNRSSLFLLYVTEHSSTTSGNTDPVRL